MPSCAGNISVSAPAGQPLPGSSASSPGNPHEMVGVPARLRLSPRQMSGRSSRTAKEIGMLAMESRLRESERSKRSADHADAEAFDCKVVLAQIDDDGLELGILREQFDGVAAAAQALHRDLVVHPRHHDLARARLARAVHGEQVAVENACIAHAHAADFQQVVGARLEQGGIDLAAPLDMLLRENRAACGDAADERQPEALGKSDAARSTRDRKSTRLNSSHLVISYAVFCLKKKKTKSQTSLS